ncbi:DUF3426 domain-containing protein [Kaistia geumhonensis]|uniref:DUF3426 domain-containing protein n=1 Tax=Kaistia geumhonensis TaxID=410839 RepID=A0ABU0M8F6_9HYPH|nr:DUF3426 domain-containing protein [Kaistia geumhonensis]MCX5477537.1 DUF3426 domain-containing protein [Kaistia geumhonensis]MDQ0517256.1 hypothetical protein [Kaistia geumhonensis]
MSARGAAGEKAGQRRSAVPTLLSLALLVIVVAVAVLGRTALVGAAPGLARLYAAVGVPVNVVGLDLVDIYPSRDVEGGAPGLVVEGTIVNVTSRKVDVPSLRLTLLDASGERVGGWQAEPTLTRLAPGESQKFRTRLASPPDQARKVSVSFASPGTKG